jgi:hypothetical protein
MKSGWVVPTELREEWKLTIGKSEDKLPALLKDLGQIDMFIHDSEHSYENMIWEYRVVWSNLKLGGILLSDDVNFNDAFWDFSRETKIRPVLILPQIAGLKKNLNTARRAKYFKK